MPILNHAEWRQFLDEQPRHSLLQTAEWGEVKAAFGWTPVFVRVGDAGALVLFRALPLGLTVAYIPRGPLGSDLAPLWKEIHTLCRQRHAVFLRVEPEFGSDAPGEGFRPAFATVQPPRTIMVSLEGSEEEWLARMNQKTRYNIRLSQKKELEFAETYDAEAFHKLMSQTGNRDNFSVHSEAYYRHCLDVFRPSGKVRILQASYAGEPIAALMLFIEGSRGYYLYGASSDKERGRMPNHLLQWRAMQICKAAGCEDYDLWGIPDEDEDVLEAQFQERHDGLWQVYRFKRGFGGQVMRTAGSFDYVYLPLLYRAAAFWQNRRKRSRA